MKLTVYALRTKQGVYGLTFKREDGKEFGRTLIDDKKPVGFPTLRKGACVPVTLRAEGG